MSALRDYQLRFRAFLTDQNQTSTSGAAADDFASQYAANAGIYRNNVRHAHVGALAAIFPAIRALIGEDYFDAVAARFANQYPPRGAVLSGYGADFPDHLATKTELSDIAFLPDVARLEWAMNEAFHGCSSLSLTPDKAAILFAASDDDQPLALLPGARLLAACAPVHAIRQAALAGDADAIARLDPAPGHLLVFRRDGDVRVETLSPGEFAFLGAITRGDTLENSVGAALTLDNAFTPAEAIGRLLYLGVFEAPEHLCKGN